MLFTYHPDAGLLARRPQPAVLANTIDLYRPLAEQSADVAAETFLTESAGYD